MLYPHCFSRREALQGQPEGINWNGLAVFLGTETIDTEIRCCQSEPETNVFSDQEVYQPDVKEFSNGISDQQKTLSS
ncbi:hypothetical protein FOH24_00080 [Acetobacter tropicalis]|uniref:Uncharacterized protein n=1 Tax=Acetobacter tropicalis TaxID=104102 RepID=A0A094ZJL2_9PROT|nr:hypothetical protein [Acetobacter tropicalis]KAA8390763.1 hypothetical protein FOH22_02515 [Acetobacter tropicalis]KAA8393172.1 hypothetical protein FOH24_00080 [Acetobacter tropicalis]KGB22646.1 hypothetical protein AtDm6_2227 [Acetobacter tropicalis]